jgi:hypothetical protein
VQGWCTDSVCKAGAAAEHVVELLVDDNPRSLALLHRILPSALMLSLSGQSCVASECVPASISSCGAICRSRVEPCALRNRVPAVSRSPLRRGPCGTTWLFAGPCRQACGGVAV